MHPILIIFLIRNDFLSFYFKVNFHICITTSHSSVFSRQMDPVQKAVINHTFGVTPPRKKPIISCNICHLRFNSTVSGHRSKNCLFCLSENMFKHINCRSSLPVLLSVYSRVNKATNVRELLRSFPKVQHRQAEAGSS